MTHEFINIMKQARIWHRLGRKSVLASVVDFIFDEQENG